MNRLVGSRLSVACLCWFAAACTERAPAPDLPGYNHEFAKSRFETGEIVSELDQFEMRKIVGTVGTFSTQLVSGAVVALPNVPFPDPAFGVFPGDADGQNAAVRSYFVNAGLPENQIASVSAYEAGLVRGDSILQGWWSVLNRAWDGIPIDDSIATAAFDANERSSAEQVYWPVIPGELLEEVRAFQDMLSDPSQRDAYIQKLPASSRDAVIVIRHTSWFWKGPFQATVCCRGHDLNGLCFDMKGHPTHLIDEETPVP